MFFFYLHDLLVTRGIWKCVVECPVSQNSCTAQCTYSFWLAYLWCLVISFIIHFPHSQPPYTFVQHWRHQTERLVLVWAYCCRNFVHNQHIIAVCTDNNKYKSHLNKRVFWFMLVQWESFYAYKHSQNVWKSHFTNIIKSLRFALKYILRESISFHLGFPYPQTFRFNECCDDCLFLWSI